MTKIRQTVDFIAANPQGLTFTQIQEFRFKLSNPGKNFHETRTCKTYEGKLRQERIYRGWGVSNLLDVFYRGPGILTKYCTKVGKLYFRNEVPYSGR